MGNWLQVREGLKTHTARVPCACCNARASRPLSKPAVRDCRTPRWSMVCLGPLQVGIAPDGAGGARCRTHRSPLLATVGAARPAPRPGTAAVLPDRPRVPCETVPTDLAAFRSRVTHRSGIPPPQNVPVARPPVMRAGVNALILLPLPTRRLRPPRRPQAP
jgi:hypothetical protein